MREEGRLDPDGMVAGRIVVAGPNHAAMQRVSDGGSHSDETQSNGAQSNGSNHKGTHHVSDDNVSLARSRQFCEHLTRTQAKNFYYGLKLLPEPKRSAMFALYAYMRLVDDIADDGRSPEHREADLEVWREQTHAVLQGRVHYVSAYAGHDIWPAFAEMVRRHGLPAGILDDVIAGQQQDLRPVALQNFEQLYEYCYRVAGTVGLASIYVWGFEGGEETELLAVQRGVAFQLTNILRDLREDGARGRTYLPSEELAAYGIDPTHMGANDNASAFEQFMRFQIERAESYYERSQALESRVHRDAQPTLLAMTEIYRRILHKMAANPQRVLRERVSLSLLSKLHIGWRAARAR